MESVNIRGTGQNPSSEASKGKRQVYIDSQWHKFDIWEMDYLQAGNRIDGLAIIEHPMTILVIPPKNYVEFDDHRFIHYKTK